MRKFKNYQLYLLMIPAYAMIALIIFFPIGFTVYASLLRWRGEGFDMKFIGLQNYIDMFNDPRFLNSLYNNIIWIILYLILPMIGGFVLALLLNTNLKGQTFFKVVFYLPGVISFVVVGIIFSLIFNSSHGMLNEILRALHLDILAKQWLGSRLLALPSIIIASSWQYVGFCMILYLAGLQSIPMDVLEAAEVDGAKFHQKVFKVIIPLLKPVNVVVVMITLINSIRVFDLVYVITHGGPFRATETIGFVMYDVSFRALLWGEGSAYGVFIFLLTTIPSIIYVRHMLKTEVSY
ncbi:MAG: sugar ABC transporter permease [Actinobacteria bacterium]|nr:sugar ABC transporter permease [Actinomycetota bacterium]